MNPILKKLLYKDQNPLLLLSAPWEFQITAKDFARTVHTSPKGNYNFILAFVRSKADARSIAKKASKAIGEKGIFWMAYPKGTSKKYNADINRDTAHALMKKEGFDGVSLIALDEDWSAMRFKKIRKK